MVKKFLLFFSLLLIFIAMIGFLKIFDKIDFFSDNIAYHEGNNESFDRSRDIYGDDGESAFIAFPPLSYLSKTSIDELLSNDFNEEEIILSYNLLSLYYEIYLEYEIEENEIVILIDGRKQKLYLVNKSQYPIAIIKEYDISTSKEGFGNEIGSQKTPLGIHRIREKIGEGAKPTTVFEYRINTGRTTNIIKERRNAKEEEITSRILWLEGLEDRNKNSLERYIYIHGTNEEGLVGFPESDGCIRMKNKDVIELFSVVEEGSYVYISDGFERENY